MSVRAWLVLAFTVVEAGAALIRSRWRISRADGNTVVADLPLLSEMPSSAPPDADAQARHVARALAAAVRRLPWTSSCLVQALAAARMLRRRGIPAALLLGVRRTPDGTVEAHAWVRVGARTVCGAFEQEEFTVLSIHAIEHPWPTGS